MSNNKKDKANKYNFLIELEDSSPNEKDKIAYRHLLGFCEIDLENFPDIDNRLLLETIYKKYKYGSIFKAHFNQKAFEGYEIFVSCILEIKLFINSLLENLEIDKIKRIFKKCISEISENTEKPYKTGILDFIKKVNSCVYFDCSKLFENFNNYYKDMSNFTDKNKLMVSLRKNTNINEVFIKYIDDQQSLAFLLNTLLDFNTKPYNNSKRTKRTKMNNTSGNRNSNTSKNRNKNSNNKKLKDNIREFVKLVIFHQFKAFPDSIENYKKILAHFFGNYPDLINDEDLNTMEFEDIVNGNNCKFKDVKKFTCENKNTVFYCGNIIEDTTTDESKVYFKTLCSYYRPMQNNNNSFPPMQNNNNSFPPMQNNNNSYQT
jgi:hypothetical protein